MERANILCSPRAQHHGVLPATSHHEKISCSCTIRESQQPTALYQNQYTQLTIVFNRFKICVRQRRAPMFTAVLFKFEGVE